MRAYGWAGLASLAMSACASQSGMIAPPGGPVAETVARLPSSGAYALSPEELALDCRKLTGRMAVRIVQIRDFQSRAQTTSLSRGIQSASKPAFGGSGEGSDPEGRYARDRAQLTAYNARLAEKNCANFDLDAELAPGAKDPPRTRKVNRS
ncbi:MAG: hypothetical protein AB7S70_00475 [Hyphomicrobium sp.]|uniref:hypothetical protein n=1 Tax=Hyphomicrobium sp. TaxID=82 RepID=UPI003D0CFC1B